MKKRIQFQLLMAFICGMFLSTSNAIAQSSLGEMKLYFAKQTTSKVYEDRDYQEKVNQGQLLGSSIGSMTVTIEGNNYQFEDYPGSEPEIFTVKRADVEVKTYTMSTLPISSIGQCMNFASIDGRKARIFKSKTNGRRYIGCKSTKEANSLRDCYVISVEMLSEEGEKIFVEGPAAVKNGDVTLEGFFLHKWYPTSGSPSTSSYDQSGKMLRNLKNLENETDPASYAMAYIASEKALYVEGNWYYTTETKEQSSSEDGQTPASTSNYPADLPLDEILKLVDQKISAKQHLANHGFKFVGENDFGSAFEPVPCWIWSRNCICDASGNAKSFQKGNSSVITISDMPTEENGRTMSLSIEVFNSKACELLVTALIDELGFYETGEGLDQFGQELMDQMRGYISEKEYQRQTYHADTRHQLLHVAEIGLLT